MFLTISVESYFSPSSLNKGDFTFQQWILHKSWQFNQSYAQRLSESATCFYDWVGKIEYKGKSLQPKDYKIK